MRLPPASNPPADLSPEQKTLYDEMRKGIASKFNAFKVEREDGALRLRKPSPVNRRPTWTPPLLSAKSLNQSWNFLFRACSIGVRP